MTIERTARYKTRITGDGVSARTSLGDRGEVKGLDQLGQP